MKKFVVVTLAVFVLATCSLWAQSSNVSGREAVSKAAPTSLVKHTLKGTYNSVVNNVTYAAGFTAVDAANNVVCPGTAGNCLISADQWAQIGANASGGRVAICFYVDGASVNGCYFNGEMLASGNYAMFSVSQGITVPFGTHTVQTFVYTDGGGFGGYFNANYRVYKP